MVECTNEILRMNMNKQMNNLSLNALMKAGWWI